jgi:hypothetical protein
MHTESVESFFARSRNSRSTILHIAVLVLLLAANGLALATDQKSSSNPCNLNPAEAAGLNGDFSTQVHATNDYMATIARLLKQEKFEELDCLADRARSNKERFPGGAWKLHQLYVGLAEAVPYPQHATEEDWKTTLTPLHAWVDARPQSVTARVALARAYLNYAYDARGEGNAGTVSDGGWKLLAERTAEARRILMEASTLPTKCPEWYIAMELVAMNEGWNAANARALFEQAFRLEPGYFYHARILANYLLPKWSGEEGDTENFTQEIADRIGGTEGDIFYYQVATASFLFCGCEGDPKLSMTRIERGFEASEKQYGVSMLNLNRMAFLSARTRPGDPIFADKTLTRIGEQWDEETWKEKTDFDAARNFSAFMAKRMLIEAAADANTQSPEGLRYKASFEQPYKELVRQCVPPGNSDVGKFKALTSVGADGTVEDIRIYWNSAASHCMYAKLHSLQLEKAKVFPPPPHASYWIRLDLDWSEFSPAPVAAK